MCGFIERVYFVEMCSCGVDDSLAGLKCGLSQLVRALLRDVDAITHFGDPLGENSEFANNTNSLCDPVASYLLGGPSCFAKVHDLLVPRLAENKLSHSGVLGFPHQRRRPTLVIAR